MASERRVTRTDDAPSERAPECAMIYMTGGGRPNSTGPRPPPVLCYGARAPPPPPPPLPLLLLLLLCRVYGERRELP